MAEQGHNSQPKFAAQKSENQVQDVRKSPAGKANLKIATADY